MNRPRPIARSLLAGAIVAASLAIGCSPSSKGSQPQFASDPATPVLVTGARVQVNRQGQFYPATVQRDVGGGRYLIRYDGAGPEYDEVVGPERMRVDDASVGAGAVARDYRPGEKVLVSVQQGRQALGEIVQQVSQDAWRIHYDGFGPEVAETVAVDRLRRPYAGNASHAVGAPVIVNVQGRPMPARVVALIAAEQFLVRFDGFGPQYDQALPPHALQAPAATPPPGPAAPTPVAAAPAPATPVTDKADAAARGKSKDKAAKTEPVVAPVVPSGPIQVGESVFVTHRGGYHLAQTTAAGATPGSFRVRYDGPSSTPEEEVLGDRVMRAPVTPKGHLYGPNQKVFVEWHGMFFPAKVLKETGKGQYKVRFDGLGPETDEIVISKRLRPRS